MHPLASTFLRFQGKIQHNCSEVNPEPSIIVAKRRSGQDVKIRQHNLINR